MCNYIAKNPVIGLDFTVKEAYCKGSDLYLKIFKPVEGTTEEIKIGVPKEQTTVYTCTQKEYDKSFKHEGFVYITTDTKRIYIGNTLACNMNKDKGNKPVENNITCDPKEVMKQYAVYRDSCK